MDSPIQSEFDLLMQRVHAGDQDAAQEVFTRYADAVRRVVRRWLGQPHRRVYDSNDVAQSVWASFFQIPADRYSFQTSEELIAFLSKVAYHKVLDKTRRGAKATAPDLAVEVPFDELEATEQGTRPNDIPSPVPSPSKYLMADERWKKLTNNLPPGHIRILEMLVEGYSDTAIAEHLGHDRKVIQRLLDRLKDLMRRT